MPHCQTMDGIHENGQHREGNIPIWTNSGVISPPENSARDVNMPDSILPFTPSLNTWTYCGWLGWKTRIPMFTGSSPNECMLSGGPTNFGQGCPHTMLSNRCWRGAWRRVMVLREGGAWKNPSDSFGICQDLPALKWTMWCSNWHQSHIRRVNNTKTYHRRGKHGALLIQKRWCHSLNWGLHLMQTPHFGT